MLESSMPIAPDVFVDHDVDGVSTPARMDAFAAAFAFPSLRHPGFIHYEVIGRSSKSESRKPIAPHAVGFALDNMLAEFGLKASELRWTTKPATPRDRDDVAPKEQGDVYFIQPVGGGLVKIGVSRTPSTRLRDLQVGSPVDLHIVRLIEGAGYKFERELHRRFGRFRVRGEWFDPCVLAMVVEP